jgi:hypothetical protein
MIKVTVGEQNTQSEKPFPKLMNSKGGRIVVMINCNDMICEGFQLNNAYGEEPHFSRCFIEEDFTDYNEPITLQNA